MVLEEFKVTALRQAKEPAGEVLEQPVSEWEYGVPNLLECKLSN